MKAFDLTSKQFAVVMVEGWEPSPDSLGWMRKYYDQGFYSERPVEYFASTHQIIGSRKKKND